MRNSLSSLVMSEAEYKAVLSELRSYHKWLLQNHIQHDLKTKQNSEPQLSPAASQLLANEFNDALPEIRKLEKFILNLEDNLRELPRVRITLAALPSVKLKKSISEWFRQEINPDLLIDFRFNSALLGGMAVQIGSHIYDWSFRDRLVNSRETLIKALTNV